MTIIQAILSACVLLIVFVADRIIKSIAKRRLDRTEPATNEIALHNLQTVSVRNKRLANLALFAFAALLIVQILSVFNATNNQNQKTMHDITTRVTKIERYIWGDGGGTGKSDPNAPDLGGRLENIEKKLSESQNIADANANLALINKAILEMKAEIGELREQIKASKKPVRMPAHSH